MNARIASARALARPRGDAGGGHRRVRAPARRRSRRCAWRSRATTTATSSKKSSSASTWPRRSTLAARAALDARYEHAALERAQSLVQTHRDSKLHNRHLLALGDLYAAYARRYTQKFPRRRSASTPRPSTNTRTARRACTRSSRSRTARSRRSKASTSSRRLPRLHAAGLRRTCPALGSTRPLAPSRCTRARAPARRRPPSSSPCSKDARA